MSFPRSPTDELNLKQLSLGSSDEQQQLKSPRSSSSYTTNINADIQAKLLAFQEQRQSKPSSNASSPLQEHGRNEFDLSERKNDDFNRQFNSPNNIPHSKASQQVFEQIELQRKKSVQQHQQKLHQKQQQEAHDQQQQRLPQQQQQHLQQPQRQQHQQLQQKESKSLPPLPPLPSPSSASSSSSASLSPSLTLRDPPPGRLPNSSPTNGRLNPIRPAPPLPINSQVSPQIAARLPKQKQSLSQRRGMKFPGGLPSLNQPTVTSTTNSLSSKEQDQQQSQQQQVKNPQEQGKDLNDDKSSVEKFIDKRGKLSSQQSLQLKGLFQNYSEYIDIKSGSLNFADKLSLSSTGVNFGCGQQFSISAEDLEFIEELGRGNYGTVSKVLHKPSGVIMAMKEVRLELDESKFRQILMELQVLHNCDSPYIVDFFGAFFVEGAVYMCIEYMDGSSLDKIYGDGVDEPHLAYITKAITKGLRELKEKHSIIHRDVKPTNILINTKGKVKLCDFGVSGNLVASLAKTNIGCQSYMAPERIKSLNPDDSSYSVQSDVWSLGLTILETAKGCYPYPPETFDNIFSQLSAIVEGSPPELPEKYSVEARDFVKKCLDKKPDRRPNYSELLEHPWLHKYKDEDLNMGEYIQHRIQEYQAKKLDVDNNNYEELNHKLKTPALHRGGALRADDSL